MVLIAQSVNRDGQHRNISGLESPNNGFRVNCQPICALVVLLESSNRSCFEARDLANEHLASVRANLSELKALERSFADFAKDCETACAGGPGPDAVILEDLSRPRRTSSVRPKHRSQ